MGLLGERTITRRRYPTGSWSAEGIWTGGSPTDANITATVQPLNGRELQTIPEFRRAKDTIKVYTEDADGFRTEDQHAHTQADRLVIDAVVYEVFNVSPHGANASLLHQRCFAARLDESTL